MGKKKEKEPDRILLPGKPDLDRCDNKVVSARYTIYNFIPVAVSEQFRRFANLYFLIVGCIMAGGYYSSLYESAISPWTTLGPLAFVISVSLLVEGNADYKRHVNDGETNNAPCVILRRSDEIEAEEGAERDDKCMHGRDVIVNINKAFYDNSHASTHGDAKSAKNVKVGFQKVRRMDIRQGHFVLVKNREMVPADLVLFASSNDGGSAYIETSSIDGETNLKLRTSPQLPKSILKSLRGATKTMDPIDEEELDIAASPEEGEDATVKAESLEDATKRLTRFSYLGRPEGESILEHPNYVPDAPQVPEVVVGNESMDLPGPPGSPRRNRFSSSVKNMREMLTTPKKSGGADDGRYIAALTTEPPNPSVHTFQGKLTLPPFEGGGDYFDIPLGAENVLLRGAVIRNTEWVIGIAFFTGTDTKLVQNSFETPSKFSQLDRLMNNIVAAILCMMGLIISYLSTQAVRSNDEKFGDLWYIGLNKNTTEKWPYLPDLDPPKWETSTPNWIQYFLLYCTLLNNFVPLSLYVTVEFITFCMLAFIYTDLNMYDNTTNTRAVARSTIVTDLGRIQYIFSDKTGTLTQNVMRFKRCSVDGMAFGAPIQKSAPKADDANADLDEPEPDSFQPLRHLLVGQMESPGLGGLGSEQELGVGERLTFNSEMFLRIMCLCHTVVVEKDIDKKEYISGNYSTTSNASSTGRGLLKFRRKTSGGAGSVPGMVSPLSAVSEDGDFVEPMDSGGSNRKRADTGGSFAPGHGPDTLKAADGAPYGYAYQAESPDEGALVSAASNTFGFQVINRDSSGIKVRIHKPSHFEDPEIVQGLKSGGLSLRYLAAKTASGLDENSPPIKEYADPCDGEPREETWTILAVNKFDSTRKRMSILLRSPPELGELPILFCKGADSAMLEPGICTTSPMLQQGEEMQVLSKPVSMNNRERDVSNLTTVSESSGDDRVDVDGWEVAQMLGIQAHLGDFASEGLRTLVLGMKILSEDECSNWLEQYNKAAVSLTNRADLLTEAALAIETDLHIAGATAIEDKLQKGVPKTIATLEKAGIKLWVLTGDKRETAVEIGYSTHVLTPKMHVTECGDYGKHHVRTQISMEFIRLVKRGRLPEYQKVAIDEQGKMTRKRWWDNLIFALGKIERNVGRSFLGFWIILLNFSGLKDRAIANQEILKKSQHDEENLKIDYERRRLVREKAEMMIKRWLESDEGKAQQQNAKQAQAQAVASDDDLSLTSEETPRVFNRAASAKTMLDELRNSGKLSQSELRKLSLAHLTAKQGGGEGNEEPLVDEDTLSLNSFFPGNKDDLTGNFDKKRRTLLERMFAIDKQVRKGQLRKHVHPDKLAQIQPSRSDRAVQVRGIEDGPRALVIEGAALKHLLGDPLLEEILFSVASSCEAVIACRVSPQQKALLVNLVRQNVTPEPITLAIGDGANDVGMIQEAHVGIGISGKEGKQAVNASDFAISQFRFLEDLILIHGRWDFFRLSTVILFSFYKNAVMAGVLVVFTSRSVYSGTPLYDEWLIAMLNFVAGMPIIMTGLFDRCLSKEYVRAHPEVYKATKDNELMTPRTMLRWAILVFIHVFTLYFFTVPQQSFGGGITSAWDGLMRNNDRDAPGDGEGGDLKSVGTVTYTCMVLLLAYKVLFETRSIVHGRWPSFTFRKDKGEGFHSRLHYTWIGVVWFSIFFYLFAIFVYERIGRKGASAYSRFVDTTSHVLTTRSMSWMIIVFVPIFGIVFDVTGKVYANLFFPTQTQIHLEMESQQKVERRKQYFLDTGVRMRRGARDRTRNAAANLGGSDNV
uniref:P-type sodium-transporting ATPase4 n=1 Tax=Amphora coffeiformis TaxID=265554 RepID=A0A7S3KZS3_9STRA